MLSFSHQASDAIGSLIAEFTLQFRTYETIFSQGGAFDKDATKPALKTVWFLVDPVFGFIFCVEYLFYF